MKKGQRKQNQEEAEKLADEFSTPARKLSPAIQGEQINEPLLFDNSIYRHKLHELRLQYAIKTILKQAAESNQAIEYEEAITQACADLNLSKEWADKYFSSPRYKRWFQDRMMEIEANLGLSIEYLAAKHKDNIEGKIRLTSSQLDSMKEVGDRFWPKISRIEHEISQKESVTLDDMPDFQKKVEELEQKFRDSLPLIPPNADAA